MPWSSRYFQTRYASIAEAGDDAEDAILFNLLADYLQRVRRVVVVIADDKFDLPTVDAAFGVVDEIEVGAESVGDGSVGSGRAAAHRQVRAEEDLRVAHTGYVFAGGCGLILAAAAA
jgi:hypothetical protein